jgi:anti-anti-sigma regulatory factor
METAFQGNFLGQVMAAVAKKSVILPAIVDLDAIDSVRDRLIDAVEQGPVVINAAPVERVATNALFMMLSAAETARRNSFSLAIEEPSETMLLAIDRLGLGENFAGVLTRTDA